MRYLVFVIAAIGLTGCLVVAGCGGGSSGSGSSSITVSITSPASAPTIQAGQTVNITAAVANDSSNAGVTWSVSGGGTLSNQTPTTVTYIAPASVTANTTVTVTATSVTSTTQSASLTITVTPTPTISVTITNPISTIAAGAAAVTLDATVQNDSSNSGVTWTLTAGGSDCSPTCGTLTGTTASATYTPPASVPASPDNAPTITATSVADTTKSASDTFTITSTATNDDALLSGKYAFLVSGQFSALAASITANGSGVITGGEEDIVEYNQPPANVSITSGTYTVGSDHRGTLSYTDANGNSFTFAIALGAVSGGVATQGQMVLSLEELDGAIGIGVPATGSLALQNSAAFSLSSLAGSYAFGFPGWDDNAELSVSVGSFTLSSAGTVSNALVDQNDNGTVTLDETFTGSLGSADGINHQGGLIDANGRGTFSLTLGGNTETLPVYVVSAGEWFAVAVNGEGSVSYGEVLQQTGGPYSLASLNGNAIFEEQSETGVPSPLANLGILTFSGSGAASYSLDVDDGGGADTPESGRGLTYALDSASNGKFTLETPGTPLTLYMIAPNQAFVLDTNTEPGFGTIEPQTSETYSNSSVQGSFFIGTLPLVGRPATEVGASLSYTSGVLTLNGTTGDVSGTVDTNSSSGLFGTETTVVSDTYSVAADGRATTGSEDAVIYFVSPTKFYFLTIPSGATANPTIGVGEQ